MYHDPRAETFIHYDLPMKTTRSLDGAPEPRHRGLLDSFTDMPTHLVTLSPAFLSALRRVAPKTRSRKLRYVAALGAVVAIGVAFGPRALFHPDAPAHVTAAALPIAAPTTVLAPPPHGVAPTTAAPRPIDPSG